MAIAEVIGLPLKEVRFSDHVFLRWILADGTTLNWDTNIGAEITDEQYCSYPATDAHERLSPDEIAYADDSPRALLHRAKVLQAVFAFEESIEVLDTLIDEHSSTQQGIVALLYRGKARFFSALYEEALPDFDKFIQHWTENHWVCTDSEIREGFYFRGQCKDRLGDIDAAIEDYRDSGIEQVFFEKSSEWYAKGDYGKAQAYITESLKDDAAHEGSLLIQGNLFLRNDALEEAMAHYDKALGVNPDSFLGHFNKAALFRIQGEHEEAIRELERARAISPDDPFVYVLLGYEKEEVGDYQEAAEAFTEVHAASHRYVTENERLGPMCAIDFSDLYKLWARGGVARLIVTRAQDWEKREKLDIAGIYARKALEDETLDNPMVRAELVGILGHEEESNGNLDEAIKLHTEALGLSGWAFKSRLLRGLLYKRQGRFQEAIDDLSIVAGYLGNPPDPDPEIVEWVGDCFLADGKHEEAIAEYTKALSAKDSRENPACFAKRGIARLKLEEFDEAFHDFERAAIIDRHLSVTGSFSALASGGQEKQDDAGRERRYRAKGGSDALASTLALIETYLSDHDYENAAIMCQHMVEQRPDMPVLWIMLGETLQQADRVHEAVTAFQKAVELAPKSPLGYYRLASIREESDDLPATVDLYKRLIQLRPDDAGLRYQLALNHVWLNDTDAARNALVKALELEPDMTKAQWVLGLVYHQLKQYDAARAQFAAAADRAPEDLNIDGCLARALRPLQRHNERGYRVLTPTYERLDIAENVYQNPLNINYKLYDYFFGNSNGPEDVSKFVTTAWDAFWPDQRRPAATIVIMRDCEKVVLLWDEEKEDYVGSNGKGIPTGERIVIFHDPDIFDAAATIKEEDGRTAKIKYHQMGFMLNDIDVGYIRDTYSGDWKTEKVAPSNTTFKSVIYDGTEPDDPQNTFIFRMPMLKIPRGLVVNGKEQKTRVLRIRFNTYVPPNPSGDAPVEMSDPGPNEYYEFALEGPEDSEKSER